jgi:Mg2+-importing ATPase
VAKERLEEYGPNVLSYKSASPWWLLLWNAFFHPFNIILLVLATISAATSDISTLTIMVTMVVISVGLRFWQVHDELTCCQIMHPNIPVTYILHCVSCLA